MRRGIRTLLQAMIGSDAMTAFRRYRSRDTERKVPMSFQFQPSDLADATPISFPAPQQKKEEHQMNAGWWMLPFLASGTMFWLWFIPTMTKTII